MRTIWMDQLWIPILITAVLVFVASSLIHMVFKWHNRDYTKFANEDDVRKVIRAGNPVPGQYIVPYCADMKDMKTPEMQQKFTEGPIGFMMIRPSGMPSMGPMLGMWFVMNLAVAILATYVASRTLPAGSTAMQICREMGIITFLAYSGGSIANSIWMGKTWPSTMRDCLDALIYAAVTVGVFAWYWPPK